LEDADDLPARFAAGAFAEWTHQYAISRKSGPEVVAPDYDFGVVGVRAPNDADTVLNLQCTFYRGAVIGRLQKIPSAAAASDEPLGLEPFYGAEEGFIARIVVGNAKAAGQFVEAIGTLPQQAKDRFCQFRVEWIVHGLGVKDDGITLLQGFLERSLNSLQGIESALMSV